MLLWDPLEMLVAPRTLVLGWQPTGSTVSSIAYGGLFITK
jgi:hypothetical protein